jgi:PleD family two-component response regulator
MGNENTEQNIKKHARIFQKKKKKMRVLIVAEKPMVAKAIAQGLSENGYSTVCV